MIIDESCGKKVKNDTGQIMSGNCDGVGKDTHVFSNKYFEASL